MTMTVHNLRLRQFHRTSNWENPSSGYRDMGSASLAAARPTAHPPGPWRQYPSSPEGWGLKRCDGRMDWTIHRAHTLKLIENTHQIFYRYFWYFMMAGHAFVFAKEIFIMETVVFWHWFDIFANDYLCHYIPVMNTQHDFPSQMESNLLISITKLTC